MTGKIDFFCLYGYGSDDLVEERKVKEDDGGLDYLANCLCLLNSHSIGCSLGKASIY